MLTETPHFIATPWRTGEELVELRRWFYDREGVDARRRGVEKVLAWRVRKPDLPLLLDSTADIVDAVLQDESAELEHNALRLVYAAAISRFVTGFTDTQLDLRRSRPSWHVAETTTPFLDFPRSLLETRHNIVHRQLPSLSTLKRAAQHSLQWLWDWYWSNLEVALCLTASRHGASYESGGSTSSNSSSGELRDRMDRVLKTYVRTRKTELKNSEGKKKNSKKSAAADTAFSSLTLIAPLSPPVQNLLLSLLIHERHILPKTLGANGTIAAAFLIWDAFVLRVATALPTFFGGFVDALLGTLKGRESDDPIAEAFHQWIAHVLVSSTFKDVREGGKAIEQTLEKCFTASTGWHLRVVESVLTEKKAKSVVPGYELWGALLQAAKDEQEEGVVEMTGGATDGESKSKKVKETMEVEANEEELKEAEVGDMDVDMAEAQLLSEESKSEEKAQHQREAVEKQRGPRKYVGMWRPKPIGALPVGWEVDSLA